MSSSLCPDLGVYAAIRMDPVAMVAHLDARAAEEAVAFFGRVDVLVNNAGVGAKGILEEAGCVRVAAGVCVELTGGQVGGAARAV